MNLVSDQQLGRLGEAHPNFKANYRILTKSETEIVLATTESGRAKQTISDWLSDPTDRSVVDSAITDKADTVFIPTYGRYFIIKYYEDGRFYLKPESGFVPCGWFRQVTHHVQY